ncbi:zf-HC2 domain-containing protein [Brevibacillus laterosporus]|uniref:zf-HC2 domain-containing protein n=1 Tax=Brevibacillus laterosporus TaxID=1465 RepID=UPI000B9B5883|nr:zf-HC2 domain-containing protein [Brevibacillus laterosporus]MBG9787012.1 transmembrane transcriptional regulator (anti-sigma factor) [Brevibacillus laterosporus]MCG7318972.1 polymer-forming cytoskeletal protein [Brevibacillus laterosporus]
MDCREAKQLNHVFLDKDIDQLSNQRLQQHLLNCEECRTHLQQLQKVIAYVESASHIQAPSDFTARVMAQLPPVAKRKSFGNWMRRHPFVTAAAVFFVLMTGSLFTSWFDRDNTLQITSANMDKLKIDKARNVVVVPAGTTLTGDLIVRNGSVEVEGEVKGNVVAIDGRVFLASTAQVAGDTESIEMIFDWVWYEMKNIGNDLLPLTH